MTSIPISNIYFLLAYAWNQLPEAGLVDVDDIEGSEVVDLLASVLTRGVRNLARRGLEQVYRNETDELRSLRGRIDVAQSARRLLLQRGLAICEYDELTTDSPSNQIVLASLKRLQTCENLSQDLKPQISTLVRSLKGISHIQLSGRAFQKIQFHRNNGFYRFLINVCRLLFDQMTPSNRPGHYRFRDFTRDPQKMPKLFESFLYNFFRLEGQGAEVKRDQIRWNASSAEDPELDFLPRMQTDISFRKPGKTIIFDAKFYESTLQARFDREKVHSGHLYQLYSYLKNLEPRGGQDAVADGVLIYPTVQQTLRLSYRIERHAIRVFTIDLTNKWQAIKSSLLELIAA